MLMEKDGRKDRKSKRGKGITLKNEKEDAFNVSNSENGEFAREAVQMLNRELEAFPLPFPVQMYTSNSASKPGPCTADFHLGQCSFSS